VAALLGQAEQALKAGDAAKAQVALEAAKKRSAEGGADKEAQRLGRLDADLALLRDLDAVDQFRCTWSQNQFPDEAIVMARTREALARFGADPGAALRSHHAPRDEPGLGTLCVPATLAEVAARVSASAVRERIVSALDQLLRQQKSDGVRALLRRVDADPYRDVVRDAVLANDWVKMAELAGQQAALEQPAGFTAFLGESWAIPVERRRQLLQSALGRQPGDLGLLMTLGGSYPSDQKESADERLRWYQAAVAAAPANYAAHINLGVALSDKGQVDEAIASWRKAIELDPKLAVAHINLGSALHARGQVEAAIACFRKGIELDPKLAGAHTSLGVVLAGQGKVEEAIACHRQAIALDPNLAKAHHNLGNALKDKGQVDEAIACYRRAIEIAPKDAQAHTNLGAVLAGKGKVDEAIACFQRAIALDPKFAQAHGALGLALLGKGRFVQAREASARALELLPENDPRRATVFQQVQTCERLVKLEGRLPGLLRGEDKPASAGESLDLVQMCLLKRLTAAAARFSAAAFAADPRLAADLRAAHRYNAACDAALAAAGVGEDAGKLDDKERARLRQQALDWLHADLVLYARQLESGKFADRAAVQKVLQHWQKDPDLGGLRNRAALAKLLPEDRADCEKLWADVAAVLNKAGALTVREQPTQAKVDKKVEGKGNEEAKLKLANEYLQAGKRDLALPLLVEIFKSKKARLGPDHPDTLNSMNQLGVVYWQVGQLDRSVPLFEELLKLHEAKRGRSHPETLHSVANLGVNYKDAGRLKEAIALLEEAQRAAQKHRELGWTLLPLLDAYTRAGANAKLATLLVAELPSVRKTLPKDSPDLAALLAQGGMALLNLKKWAEAEPLLRECLAIREKAQPDLWMTFNSKAMLGGVLLGQKKYADAEPLLLAGYQGMKKRQGTIPPQGWPRVVEAVERLVQLYEALGKKDEVARWAKELEAIKAAQEKAEKKR
jgi:tetratricopeptide (TPR) repeat protein